MLTQPSPFSLSQQQQEISKKKKKNQQPNVDPRNINQLLLEGEVGARDVRGSSLGCGRSDPVLGDSQDYPLLPGQRGQGGGGGDTPRDQAVEDEIPFL